ncbi:MAG: hypothetical protein MJZ11_06555 [Lachnospiraceae bacterium]|nr:hypothetical protein [Lachnospiraceae bacterium]
MLVEKGEAVKLSNNYNFRNPVRHFIDIDKLDYPSDIVSFSAGDELCWTKPVSFRVYKSEDKFRTIKMPNVLNFVRAYYYYNELPHFNNVKTMDTRHKRLEANLDTGDFVSGNYNVQLNEDFINLCNYDILIKLDITEYYGRIYTHYLGLESYGLNDKPLAWLNNGRTSGLLMGSYLSLYFAELLSSRIAEELQKSIDAESINCVFNYFSDDFYFFCNKDDSDKVLTIFDKTLAEYDFVRKDKKEIWTYETYNQYNLLTRYWKSTIRNWNLEILKDYENHKKHPGTPVFHKYSFLNQLIYRLSGLQDEKSKRNFIINFFKTKHFQSCDYSKYKVCSYDLHQLFFLIKYAPESLLYVSEVICKTEEIKANPNTKNFLKARYEESLKQELHDVQLYFYYAIKKMNFNDIIEGMSDLVLKTQNQVLIAYYLKEKVFNEEQLSSLKVFEGEEYWFQNYHLILYTPSLKSNLNLNIKKYLIPKRLSLKPNQTRENRYYSFYYENLQNGHSMLRDINDVSDSIKEYLELRYMETAEEFDD